MTMTMASMLKFFFLFLLLISVSSVSTSPAPLPASTPAFVTPPEIYQACKATRFTSACETTLIHLQSAGNLSRNPEPIEIIKSATWVSAQNLKTARSMMESIYDSSSSNRNRSSAAKSGLLVLHLSAYRLSLVEEALPRGRIKDARAWSSAALLYQYAAWSTLKYVNDSQLVNETMSFLNSLTELTSNALSMMVSYDLFGNDTSSWRTPMTERDGYWEEQQGSCASAGCGPTSFRWYELKTLVNATVCKEKEKGCYETVQAAVDAAPEYYNHRPGDGSGVGKTKWFVIRIREGVYNETVRIPLRRRNVVIVGDGMGKTVITGSRSVDSHGMSTFESATVGVLGDGFMARDLTFENTAGPDAHQAVAFRSDSDQTIIQNCEFLGHQDTLYADSLRQFYNSCRIEGNVDFIFGNSASVFQNCKILIRPRQVSPEKGGNNAIAAHGRTDLAQSTGFVFRNCIINGTDEYMKLYAKNPKVHRTYLGRPWKEFSRTVFVDCYMEKLVTPQGWMPWDGDFALTTLYYGESGNSGAGANMSSRVEWSSQIPEDHVRAYSLQNFIQADEWLASSSS